jgi:23S rRNA pseudouridine1911/1915/1917 synthase
MNKIIVQAEDNNQRLDKFLVEQTDEDTRSTIQKKISDEAILVNGDSVKANYKIKINDVIEIKDYEEAPTLIESENIPLDIVYEDDDLLIINKPTGMVVHPGAGVISGTLVNALMYHMQSLSDVNGAERPGIVHRIDKDTSGLIIVAKNNQTHNKLAEQLVDKTLNRQYKAIVHGQLFDHKIKIDAPIGRDKNDRTKMKVTALNSKKAVTNVIVDNVYDNYSLVTCLLETGRTHQIRVHLNYIKHPIYGDPKYGYRKDDQTYGQYLHAFKIGFIHPSSAEYMEFEIGYPPYFTEKLTEIQKNEPK